MPIKLNGSTSGYAQIQAGATAANNTLTLPDGNATLVDTSSTQTLTNKTLTSPTISGASLSNATLTGTTTAATINASGNVTVSGDLIPSSSFLRNRIINGAMMIDQRNAGASVTIPLTANTYVVDRWYGYGTQGSKFSVQQNAGGITPPTGYTNYLGATSLSAYSVGASDIFYLQQPIEGLNVADLGFGAAGAATVTLSFWVRSSLTGAFGGSLCNSAYNRNYPFSFTINSANTWEQKTVTILGDTTGTWLTTNGVGIRVLFSLGMGSSVSGTAGAWTASGVYQPTGSTSVVAVNGATFYVTGVQLEVGSNATPFERRMYGTEFGLCERYYQNAQAANEGYLTGVANASDGVTWHTSMRAAPTIAFSNLAYGGTASGTYNAIFSTISGVGVYSGTTGAGNYYWHVTVVGTAEL